MAVALTIGFHIKKLFQFKLNAETDLVFKWLIFSNIRHSYLRIITIIRFPITQCDDTAGNSDPIVTHLQSISTSDLNLATEMQTVLP